MHRYYTAIEVGRICDTGRTVANHIAEGGLEPAAYLVSKRGSSQKEVAIFDWTSIDKYKRWLKEKNYVKRPSARKKRGSWLESR